MLQTSVEFGRFVMELVLLHWLAGSLIVLLVALVLRATPNMNAATRFRIWWGVLLVVALLPSALFLRDTPLGQLAQRVQFSPAFSSQSNSIGEPADSLSASGLASLVPSDQVASDQVSLQQAAEPATSLTTARAAGILGMGLFVCWLILMTRRLAALLRALIQLSVMRRASIPASNVCVAELERLTERAGLRTVPALRTVPELSGPACAGLAKPWIGIPTFWPGELSAQARSHALLHEVAHIHRHDAWWNLTRRLAEAVTVLHPATRFLSRQLDLEGECACDDWAIAAANTEPAHYGESLLEFARARTNVPSTETQPNNLLASSYTSSQTQLRRRVINMIDQRRSHRTSTKATPVLLLGSAVVFASLASASVWPTPPSLPSGLAVAYEPAQGLKFTRSADDAPLYFAVRSGNPDLVRRLVDGGEDPNERWPGDGSPLIVASRRGDLAMARELLDLGADVDLGVGGDGTPLIQAAAKGHLELVDLLLLRGADIDHAGTGGDGNPLIQASLRGQLELVESLVERGAVIDIHVPNDDTPLINAAQAGHDKIVEYLLNVGADPNLTGDFDQRLQVVRTPLNQARNGNHQAAVRLLLAAGARE